VIRFREQQERSRVATRWLVALFALTVLFTVAGVNAALALAWRLQFGGFFGYPRWFFETNTIVTLGFVLGGAWLQDLQLREGGAAVARLLGGREVADPHTRLEKRLRNVVDEMALASALPPLRVFVLDREDAINAFAAGWAPADSVITVTRGALERLNRDELQGVVAHEFAHVLNGDTRLNMRLIGMVFGLQMVFTFGRSLMSPVDDRGRRGPTWLAGLALAAAGSIGWFAGRLLKAGVSREREHLADAAAIQFTRQPDGLGNALRKIATQVQRGERLDHANGEFVSHLLLSSDSAVAGRWLATHPPLAERIHRIFGRDLPPLPDDVLAADEDEAPTRELPPLAFVNSPMLAPAVTTTLPTVAAIGDPLELSASSPPDTVAASVLGCLLAQPPHPAQLQAWRRLAPGGTARLVAALQSLAPLQRHPVFERALACARALPMASRTALLQAARELVQAGGGAAMGEWLQVAVLQAQLAPRERETPASHLTMGELASSIDAVTLDLATLLPTSQRAGWIAAVRRELSLPAALPAADPRDLAGALDRLRLLAPVQRPAVLKAWVAADASLPPTLAQALACLCLLIDTPAPPDLLARIAPARAVAESPQA
jgi:Zn-dependent protease with chaperone function